MKINRISELPDNIIEEILSRLSTKDAVRTSVLSRKWRHKWTTTPSIAFSFKVPESRSPEELVNVIDHVLSQHVGPIHKFKLFCGHPQIRNFYNRFDQCLPDHDIDRWILGLSRSQTEELSLVRRQIGAHYPLPSCVFSFENLTKLELGSYLLMRPPATFKGFVNLKILCLHYVSLAQDVLEILICSCPALERLSAVVTMLEISMSMRRISNSLNFQANVLVLLFGALPV